MTKSICDSCVTECLWRANSGGNDPPVTQCKHYIQKPMTNYDRIVSKSPEELAKIFACKCCPSAFFSNFTPEENPCNKYLADDCFKCWLNWLKSPTFKTSAHTVDKGEIEKWTKLLLLNTMTLSN